MSTEELLKKNNSQYTGEANLIRAIADKLADDSLPMAAEDPSTLSR